MSSDGFLLMLSLFNQNNVLRLIFHDKWTHLVSSCFDVCKRKSMTNRCDSFTLLWTVCLCWVFIRLNQQFPKVLPISTSNGWSKTPSDNNQNWSRQTIGKRKNFVRKGGSTTTETNWSLERGRRRWSCFKEGRGVLSGVVNDGARLSTKVK